MPVGHKTTEELEIAVGLSVEIMGRWDGTGKLKFSGSTGVSNPLEGEVGWMPSGVVG